MEPFDVYCETCHARLRVREERFVGEIHPCPKCSSMVFIVAPIVATDASAEAAEAAGAGQATAGVGAAAKLAGIVGRHAVVWSACGAVLVVAGSVAVSLLTGGDEQIVAQAEQPTSSANAAAANIAESIDDADLVESESVENVTTPPATVATDAERRYRGAAVTKSEATPLESIAALPPLPALPEAEDTAGGEPADVAAAETPPNTSTPPPTPEPAQSRDVQPERKRTMRLDPLGFDPKRASLGNVTGRIPAVATRDYSAEIDEGDLEAKTQAVGMAGTTDEARSVDTAVQLSLRLESIDVPEMTLADFLRMVSDMAAVPIRLDPAAGVTPQTKLTVRGEDVTLGELLDEVLAEHGLAREEREGTLLLIRHESD